MTAGCRFGVAPNWEFYLVAVSSMPLCSNVFLLELIKGQLVGVMFAIRVSTITLMNSSLSSHCLMWLVHVGLSMRLTDFQIIKSALLIVGSHSVMTPHGACY